MIRDWHPEPDEQPDEQLDESLIVLVLVLTALAAGVAVLLLMLAQPPACTDPAPACARTTAGATWT